MIVFTGRMIILSSLFFLVEIKKNYRQLAFCHLTIFGEFLAVRLLVEEKKYSPSKETKRDVSYS